jgi:hypothetical protein
MTETRPRLGSIAVGGMHFQYVLLGFSVMLHFLTILRDLSWHPGVGVLGKTLHYAAKDLQDVIFVTVILLAGFAALGVVMFGSFGAQDMFYSYQRSFQTLALLGFGKDLTYSTFVNDERGQRFDGIGLHQFKVVKPLVFWILVFLLVWIA